MAPPIEGEVIVLTLESPRVKRGHRYLTTLMLRSTDMAVKPGTAGADSCRVKERFFFPGLRTARTSTKSPL